jgi:hypothetical protein
MSWTAKSTGLLLQTDDPARAIPRLGIPSSYDRLETVRP